MVIFMPYYRQHEHLFHSQSRTRPSSVSNGQNNPTTTGQLNGCQIALNILCRFACSLFLLIIAIFLLQLSIDNPTNQSEGSPIIATILLTVAIISFIRTYQRLRQYYIITDARRRLLRRLRERQQAYDLTIALNIHENPENVPIDLPSYKELFPSHPNLSTNGTELLPSYDDYVKTLVIDNSTTSLPISSLQSQTQTNNPPRCIWIADPTTRPLCIRGTVTYV